MFLKNVCLMMNVKLVDRRPVSLNCSSFVLQSSADEPHDDEAFFPGVDH